MFLLCHGEIGLSDPISPEWNRRVKEKTKRKTKKGLSFYQIANVCTYTSMSNTLPNGSVWTDFSME